MSIVFKAAPLRTPELLRFLGPRIIASHDQISGELAAEFPVLMNTTALQAVPDYRLHASIALSW